MPASEPSDPSSWPLRPSMPPHSNPNVLRTSFTHTLPSQHHPRPLQQPLPSQQPLNPHQPLPSHQPQSLPLHPTFPPQHSLPLPSALPSSTPYEPRPSSHVPSHQSPAIPVVTSRIATASATNRKRQFRFSVVADIELLQLVVNYNPYAAAHGGRLHKWQAIADTLRDVGIDIDFRRARDRTALLIDQWRKQEFALLRRSGSGNQQDQAEKERLLDIISGMEHAAKPRDHPPEWRPSQHQFMHNTSDPPVAVPPSLRPVDSPDNPIAHSSNAPAVDDQLPAHPLPHPKGANGQSNDHSQSNTNDNPSLTAAASHPYSTPLAPVSVGPLPATSSMPPTTNLNDCNPTRATALPPLLPQREVVTNIDNNPMHPSPYNPSQPMYPEKLVKTNNGKRLSSHLAHSFSPSTPLSHEDPKRKSDLAIATHHDAQPTLPSNHYAHSSMCPPRTQRVEPPASVDNMPRSSPRHVANGQNVQLEAQARDPSRAQPEHIEKHDTITQLYSFLIKLDNKMDRMLSTMTKQVEMEERRFAWEKECEKKRLQAKQERMEKEYMEREVAREERRQEQLRRKEERDLLFEIISRGRHQAKTRAEQPD